MCVRGLCEMHVQAFRSYYRRGRKENAFGSSIGQIPLKILQCHLWIVGYRCHEAACITGAHSLLFCFRSPLPCLAIRIGGDSAAERVCVLVVLAFGLPFDVLWCLLVQILAQGLVVEVYWQADEKRVADRRRWNLVRLLHMEISK